jgi:hypothetical protein
LILGYNKQVPNEPTIHRPFKESKEEDKRASSSDLDLAETSVLGNAGDNTRSSSGRSNVLALEVGNEASRAHAVESTRAAESVDLASTAQSGRASGVGRGAGSSEDLSARGAGVDGRGDVLESVALGDDGGAGADLEGVAAVGVPVVVDGVEESVAGDLGAATAGVVDVVALEGDHVVGAGEVHGPVVVAVAGGGPGGGAVDFVVGDGDTVAGGVAENDVLTADLRSSNVVDPPAKGTRISMFR